MVENLIHGYINWHMCDVKYGLLEIYDQAGETSDGVRFRKCFDQMTSTAGIELEE